MIPMSLRASDPLGTRVTLPCGHTLNLPWGISPEAGLAELLHHETVCDQDPAFLFSGAVASARPALPPAPEVRA
jgi:hypothetical protein